MFKESIAFAVGLSLGLASVAIAGAYGRLEETNIGVFVRDLIVVSQSEPATRSGHVRVYGSDGDLSVKDGDGVVVPITRSGAIPLAVSTSTPTAACVGGDIRLNATPATGATMGWACTATTSAWVRMPNFL